MSEDRWRRALDSHERNAFAHAPILLDIYSRMSNLEKLGWQIRGGLAVLAAFVAGGILAVALHQVHFI